MYRMIIEIYSEREKKKCILLVLITQKYLRILFCR